MVTRAYMPDAGDLVWLDPPDGVVAFRRGGLECWLNTGDSPVPLPAGEVLLRSHPEGDGDLLPDTSVWLRTSGGA